MNIHEYQAKAVLKEFGVPVPKGVPAFTAGEAVQAVATLVDACKTIAPNLGNK